MEKYLIIEENDTKVCFNHDLYNKIQEKNKSKKRQLVDYELVDKTGDPIFIKHSGFLWTFGVSLFVLCWESMGVTYTNYFVDPFHKNRNNIKDHPVLSDYFTGYIKILGSKLEKYTF